jgi:hypothetical protein
MTTQVRLTAGTTLKHPVTRLRSTIHPFGAAEGDSARTEAGTPNGPGDP